MQRDRGAVGGARHATAGILIVLSLAACAQHTGKRRPEWEKCTTDGIAVTCQGKEEAKIECTKPANEWCATMTLVFASGERVELAPFGAIVPEISPEAGYISWKDPKVTGDYWQVYDPQASVQQQVDSFRVYQLRRAYQPIAIWKVATP